MIPETQTQSRPLSPRFAHALTYAFHLHQHQLRKGSSVPYISHLMSVAALVLEDGGNEDAAIAALLHDAIEDQGGNATRNEIRKQFGDAVLRIVDACTESDETPKPSWKERKLRAIAQLQQAEPAIQRVILADKLHNLRCIWTDWQRQGDRVWQRFNASPADILWFYRACLDAVGDRFSSPMLIELRTLLTNLENSLDNLRGCLKSIACNVKHSEIPPSPP
ncbi:HD domain-containing protein [Thermoleptolyngbya sichuanensis A183]|uniref:HD domain-containing protein n=1 Tax=Thermoleptolyngbya sichuanensis A183 TaxID=2737172 RepID=A0A6M8BBC6_9CYAN|nr:HD domain-containing protein [Thermoleptolyngbya sichuanensis]QKD83392.1 HD domain-containing protein [Thermoleptolyngbya sichuanensis A183]